MSLDIKLLIEEIKIRKKDAKLELAETSKEDANSYASGFEQGRYDALGELLEWIEDEKREGSKP